MSVSDRFQAHPIVLDWLRYFRDLYQRHERRTAGQVLDGVTLVPDPYGHYTDLGIDGVAACRLGWLPQGQVLVSSLANAETLPWVCYLGDGYVMYHVKDGTARRAPSWEPFRSFRRFRFQVPDILPDLVLAADVILSDLPPAARKVVVADA